MCQIALNRDIINGLRKDCDEAYEAVMRKVSTMCAGDCNAADFQGFLCTNVNAVVGAGSCDALDVMGEILGRKCSTYQTFIGAYCSVVAYYTGSGFGYSPMSGFYYATYAGNMLGQYYGSGISNVAGGADAWGYSYSNYYYRHRRLQGGAHCGDSGHADSLECLNYVSSKTDLDYFALSSSVGDPPTVLESNDDATYYAHAMAKLSETFWHISDGGVPVSLVSLGIEELIGQQLSPGGVNATLFSYELLVTIGKFLATAGTFYGSAEKVPIFPFCDAEFEESAVRDAVEISAIDSSCQPYVGAKSRSQVIKNILLAEKNFKNLPVSNFLGSLTNGILDALG
jgi:hypothetical protein